MKKIIGLLLGLFCAVSLMGQSYKTYFYVPDTATAFGTTLAPRTLIFNYADKKLYVLTAQKGATVNLNHSGAIPITSGGVITNYWKRLGDTVSLVNANDNVVFNYTGGIGYYYDGTLKSSWYGGSNSINNDYSFIAGQYNNSASSYNYIFGNSNYTYRDNQTIIGRYNDTTVNSIFSIALGQSAADSMRYNAFDVMQDSTTHINGKIVEKPSDSIYLINAGVGLDRHTLITSIIRVSGNADSANITANPQIDTAASFGTKIEIFGTDDVNVVRLENGDGLKIGGVGYLRIGKNDVATFRRMDGQGWVLTNFQDN